MRSAPLLPLEPTSTDEVVTLRGASFGSCGPGRSQVQVNPART